MATSCCAWVHPKRSSTVGQGAARRLSVADGQVQTRAVFWPLVAARSASIAWLLILALTSQRLALPARHALPLVGLAGAMDAGGNASFVLSEQAGRLDVAGTLAALYPATTVVLALWRLGERLTRFQSLGIVLALVSVPLMAG